MKQYTAAELEAVINAHGIRKCFICGEYEKPSKPWAGIGGIDAEDFGNDMKGNIGHARCIIGRATQKLKQK